MNCYLSSCACMLFQHLSSCYPQEAEWMHKNHKLRFEDKLHLGTMSIGAAELCVHTMVCMGDEIPKGA
uniref:Terpene synthase metal-binding domain-containing protein n=1 Tax=Triticum urartu TaxID=4572 RepID=A0A8R7QZF9_TRIUA